MNQQKTHVLITGANKGIGKAAAELFAAQGATILFTTRQDHIVSQLENELKDLGAADAKGYLFDICNQQETVSLVEKITTDFTHLDILVNNAGIGIYKKVTELTPPEWHDVINTNLTGVFYLTHQILPLMIKQKKGHIINVGSLAGKNTFVNGAAYCASKFGLLGFSECLMLEAREHNIKVSIIMPGSVNSTFANHKEEPDDKTWKLHTKDVAEAILAVANSRYNNIISRVELRTLKSQKEK